MRNKIIAVNAVIILIVGLLSWVLMRQAVTSAASNTGQLLGEAKHDVQGAAARLQLDALRAERWLMARAQDSATADVFQRSTEGARKDAAGALCDRILSDARGSSAFEGSVPAIVMILDANGRMLGRNGSSLNSGRDVAGDYPALKDALTKGQSGSDVWANKDKQDNFLASYATARGSDGAVVGAIVLGTTLTDEMSRVSDLTTGRALVLVAPQADSLAVLAQSAATSAGLNEAIGTSAKDSISRVIGGGRVDAIPNGDIMIASAALDGLGDGKRAALVAAAPASLIDNAAAMATPLLFVMGLGIILVIAGGWMLGNYITRPINMLEEGLLAILNGQQDKRFELDHPELGGLAFRIDQLLNQLMGIEEDTTDDQGRPSKAPSAADFRDAMSVDQGGRTDQIDPAVAQALAAEPAQAYYARIYREYIAAKKANGEQTDHITEQAFSSRIQSMERDAQAKHGRNVRYQVLARGKEVVLIAVPLA